MPDNGIPRRLLLVSRIFIMLTAILLAAMPWTEYFWNFDNFLGGGQDFELGLLAVISVFCLLAVLLQRRRHEFTIRLAIDRWLTSLFANTRFSIAFRLFLQNLAFSVDIIPQTRPHRAVLPLRI